MRPSSLNPPHYRPTVAPRSGADLSLYLTVCLTFFSYCPRCPTFLHTAPIRTHALAHLCMHALARMRPRTLSVWCFDFWGDPQKHLRGRLLPASDEVLYSGARSGADCLLALSSVAKAISSLSKQIHSPEPPPDDKDRFCRTQESGGLLKSACLRY